MIMKSMTHCTSIISLAVLGAASAYASPDPSPDPNAQIVALRLDCGPVGSEMPNCFETMESLSDLATGWIWNTRNPTATSPLLVDIGPGKFGPFHCDGGGFVTLRGSGREVTIIKDAALQGVEVKNCDDLAFIDLGVHGGQIGARWIGSGFSSWSNTDLVTTGESTSGVHAAWGDDCDYDPATYPNVERSTHYFHGSRARNTGDGHVVTSAFYTQCAENWFFGGEIFVDLQQQSQWGNAVRITNLGELRTFGTAIRARARGDGHAVGGLYGVLLESPFSPSSTIAFHSHGSIINVSADAATLDQDVIGVGARTANSFAHTPGTAFVLKPGGSGTARRIEAQGGAIVQSPFLWQSGSQPPAIESQDGSDVFVETDCGAAGDCDGGGSETHLMIYNATACGSADPWFDVVTGSCR